MIRLQRVGKKNEPTFRIVLTDSKNSTKSGKFLEILGSYDARDKNETKVDADRVKYWISQGAQPSDTIHNFLVGQKIIEGKKINVLPKKTPIKKESEEVVEEKTAPVEKSVEVMEEKIATVQEKATPAEEKSEEIAKEEVVPAEEPKKEEAPVEEPKEEPKKVPEPPKTEELAKEPKEASIVEEKEAEKPTEEKSK